MSEAERFLRWWLDDAGRVKCTLEQAVGAYLRTFPGRALPLLVELLRERVPAWRAQHEEAAAPSRKGFFQE